MDMSYYLEAEKFIRDLVHNYVYLTEFELLLIDKPEFQRLKDIQQLTCQHVYPSARHTRFEHSLGVLELTRQAIKDLNRNGYLDKQPKPSGEPALSQQLRLNAELAALLHDVGHCPYSHLGEKIFDKAEVWNCFLQAVENCPQLRNTSFPQKVRNQPENERKGAKHEQLSCVVILEKFYGELNSIAQQKIVYNTKGDILSADFELIIRSIIGWPYDLNDAMDEVEYEDYYAKNVVVRLISSSSFDMDKLDYIMRDSVMTGIGAPRIDTHRLFKNIRLVRGKVGNPPPSSLVFTAKAVPPLQNMIDARDELYMYAYNHHAAVFSDFMYTYIFRRLEHNAFHLNDLIYELIPQKRLADWAAKGKGESLKSVLRYPTDPLPSLGAVPGAYLFSPPAILEQKRSDSDLVSMLHDIHYDLSYYFAERPEHESGAASAEQDSKPPIHNREELIEQLRVYVADNLQSLGLSIRNLSFTPQQEEDVIWNMRRVYNLVDQYLRRDFLKPWWKTAPEFKAFLDVKVRNRMTEEQTKRFCEWVAEDTELCSQIAKHVIYITEQLMEPGREEYRKKANLLTALNDGDFYVIARDPHFFKKESIADLKIYLKKNELLPSDESMSDADVSNFNPVSMKEFLPQKGFGDVFQNGFYIFSRPVSNLGESVDLTSKKRKHYKCLENIFIFVADRFYRMWKIDFKTKFQNPPGCSDSDDRKRRIKQNEAESLKKTFEAYLREL